MSLDYTIGDAEGGDKINSNDVADTLSKLGYQNVSMHPDGQSIAVTDPSGQHGTIDVAQYLEDTMGGKISGQMPSEGSTNYDNVDPQLRMSIESLPNDDHLRSLYLQGALDKQGIKGAKVVGNGSDFHYFNPENGKYYALTNKPGFDFSDATGFIPQAANFALGTGGAIIGGTAGAAAGTTLGPVGTIGGGAVGAAGGGAAGRAIAQSIAGSLDPDLKKYFFSEENLKDAGKGAAVDGLFGGLSSIPGLQSIMSKGIGSNIAKGLGKVSEGVGGMVESGAQYLKGSGMIPTAVREISKLGIPGTGQLEGPAFLARAGELVPMATRGLAKGANKISQMADQTIVNNLKKFSAGEASMAEIAAVNRSALKNRQTFEGIGSKLSSSTLVPEAEETLANKFAREVRNFSGAGEAAPIAGVRDAGIKETTENLARNFAPNMKGSAKSLGSLLETSNNLGKGVQGFNEAVIQGGLKGISHAGSAAKNTGKALNTAGTVFEPLENRILLNRGLHWGSEEVPSWQKAIDKKKQARFTQ